MRPFLLVCLAVALTAGTAYITTRPAPVSVASAPVGIPVASIGEVFRHF